MVNTKGSSWGRGEHIYIYINEKDIFKKNEKMKKFQKTKTKKLSLKIKTRKAKPGLRAHQNQLLEKTYTKKKRKNKKKLRDKSGKKKQLPGLPKTPKI